jgi:probable LLM family oxidoreductase
MEKGMELGVYTFADVGSAASAGERLRNLMEEAETAEQAGLDVFGIGEHHRPDYAASAPAVILAAAAARTRRITLTSAVTVLSSDDPVRVYQQFSTLDLLSGGRAEVMVGRGSFIESFPLFGFDLDDYDELFSDRLDLLLKIRESERVSWSGRTRAPLANAGVYPRDERELPVWIAVGGTPQSIARAGTLGLPLALAIIGGEPARFKPHADLYREAGRRAGHDDQRLKFSLNMHGFVGRTPAEARDVFYPGYADVMSRIGRERGWPPLSRAQFDMACGPDGNLLVGDPEEVAAKISRLRSLFRPERLLVQMALGSVPHEAVLAATRLLGGEVARRLKDEP